MPTFDFSNIVRKVIQAAVATVSNPFVIIAALTASIYLLIDSFSGLTSIFQFPEIHPEELPFDNWDDNAFRDLILYVFDFNNLYHFYSIIKYATIGFINFMIVFTISCIGAISLWMGYNGIRRALKDYA